MRLLVISSVIHYRQCGIVYAYAPFAREMSLWSSLFDQVTIAAPCRDTAPPGDCVPLPKLVTLSQQREVGGNTLQAKLKATWFAFPILLALARAILSCDAVQVRCPGNLGLLGVIVAPLLCRRRIAKYAGQWTSYPGEPFTFRLQRLLLRSRWWRAPVIAYGEWPRQSSHVVPLFNSVLDEAAMQRARHNAARQQFRQPLSILYVGRLSAAKNVGVLLEAIRRLTVEGLRTRCTIVGEGPERRTLEAFRDRHALNTVTFTGGLAQSEVLARFEDADVLVLVSESEGWPKCVAEGMAFGLICIGSNCGLLPHMLADGRGVLVRPGDPEDLAAALRAIVRNADAYREMRRRAAEWAQQFTVERLTAQIRDILNRYWPAPVSALPGVMHLLDTLDAGGAERVAVNLVNSLPRETYRVFLCTSRRDGALAALLEPGVERVCLQRRHTLDAFAVWRLAAFIRRHRIRILHAHGPSLFLAVASHLLAPRLSVVWHVHHGHYAGAHNRALLHRLFCKGVSFLVVVNHDLVRYAEDRLAVAPARVRFVPNLASSIHPSAPVPLPGTVGKRILCVANLRPEKDHLTLVRALDVVRRQIPGVHLLLAGAFTDPKTVSRLRYEIAANALDESITLLGARTDVPALCASCDIGVLSSRSEGFPMALVDYGQAGLPVIATAVGECAQVLEGGDAGILVPPGQPGVLAAKLILLLGDAKLRRTLASAFARRVETLYSPNTVIRQICTIYETVA